MQFENNTINLLPPVANTQKTRRTRLKVFTVFLAILLVLVFAALFFLAQFQKSLYKQYIYWNESLNTINQTAVQVARELIYQANTPENLPDALDATVLNTILQAVPPGVTITNINYEALYDSQVFIVLAETTNLSLVEQHYLCLLPYFPSTTTETISFSNSRFMYAIRIVLTA